MNTRNTPASSPISTNARLYHWTAAVILVILTTTVDIAQAEGFRNQPPGALSLGRSGGRFTHVDDASAVWNNPANISELNGPEAQFTPSVVYMSVEFDSSNTGQSAETENPWKVLPNLFFAAPIGDSPFSYGLGITVPYGLSVDWDENSPAFAPGGILRYQTTHFSELATINLNPTVAWEISDRLSIGAGFNAMWSRVELEQFYPWMIFPGSSGTEPDGTLRADGHGWGFGGNVGVTWKITDRQRLSATYRSPMTVVHEGDTKINNITPTAASFGATSKSDFETQIAFPTIVGVGYGVQICDTVRVEVSAEWIQFSRFKSLRIDAAQNNVLLPSTTIPQKWRDTFTAGIGGDWRFADNWILRAGYQFYQSPVPDSTISPTIPDSDQHVFTVGLGCRKGAHGLEAAYGADFYVDRKIRNNQNPALNGDYDITVHLFSLAYNYSF